MAKSESIRMKVYLSIVVLFVLSGSFVEANDWPMWRYDSGHTSSSNHQLPDTLHLEWSRQYTPRDPAWDDPLNEDLMQYDRIFEPVVKNGRMFIGFNDADKIVALDVQTGRELWTYYTGGPVRFPGATWGDVVFFTSDDGYLYCLGAADGKLRWRFRGGPSQRKVIGNSRVISAWPARGGPVVDDNRVYFAASIWPFMGTYIYALNAESGEVEWVNDSTSAQYIKQPHSAPSFAGVGPQGVLTLVNDALLVPGGRSVPAVFDRESGKFRYFDLNAGGKGNGGSFVVGRDDQFYVHTRVRGVRAFNLESGKKTEFMTNEPVLSDGMIYAAEIYTPKRKKDKDKDKKEDKDKDKDDEDKDEDEDEDKKPLEPPYPVVRGYDTEKKVVWQLRDIDGSGDMIRAGDRLYIAGKGQLTAIELAADGKSASVAWTEDIDEHVVRLVAASNRLFAVTLDGRILAYGANAGRPKMLTDSKRALRDWGQSERASQVMELADSDGGIMFLYGLHNERFLRSVLSNSDYQVVAIDEDEGKVDRLRREMDEAGLYGSRISVHQGSIGTFMPPPYVAHVVAVGGRVAEAIAQDDQLVQKAYESVRPYGGCLVSIEESLRDETVQAFKQADLEKAIVAAHDDFVVARRVGALRGAADWTHQYGDVANTVKSNDARVRPPLGLLWFGGSSNVDVLPRHGHGPPEQVIGGRLFIEGMNSLSCRDVYTGRVIWKKDYKDLGTYDIYYDETYKDTPLDPAYNQVHIPGANGRGTNYVATDDAVYLVIGGKCHVLDVRTGRTLRQIVLPEEVGGEDREWGFIGVYNDVLLGGAGFAEYRKRLDLSFKDSDEKLSGNSKGYGSKSFDKSASSALVAFNRHNGEVLWKVDARHSFIHNGIVAGDGKVYCLDKLPKQIEDKLKRRGGVSPDTYRIIAVDYRTGEPEWEEEGGIFGTWLGYSEQFGLLLQAGASASDRLKSEVGQGMAVYRGDDGSLKWRVDDRAYSGPCILHNDTILTNANSYQLSSGAFSLLDGTPKLILNPLTNQEQPWQICRAYGCNNIIASEHMLTFRSGAAGYYDLNTLSGTGNLGGFKSGCTSNLVVANGVLNAPDYTRTCSCSYQNQTSLALVHMPEMDMWTVNHTARLTKAGQRIKRMGVNFGAPGDRVDSSGTLWLDYPTVGGDSAEIDIKVSDEASYFQLSTMKFSGPGIPWVGASGVANAQVFDIPLSTTPPPDGLQFAVKTVNDDAEEDPDGTVSLSSSDLELTKDSNQQTIGVRFTDVAIPQGTKIEKAHIQFQCDEVSDEATELVIAVEESDNAEAFADKKHNLTSRTVLEKTVEWKPKEWDKEGRAGDAERTPDLTELIQEIVNRPEWKSGNSIVFIITGEGKRVAKAHKDSAKDAPQLVMEADLPKEVDPSELVEHSHTVRLYFSEPEDIDVGKRVFDVQLNGKTVDEGLDVIHLANAPRSTIVREYKNVMLAKLLTIQLNPRAGQPLLNGVEIIRDEP